MKTKLLSLIAAVSLMMGCATTPEAQMQQLVADARDLAQLGTTIALMDNPNNRAALEFTVIGLTELELLPDVITEDALLKVLQRLPVSELQGEKAKLFITTSKIIIRRATSAVSLGSLKTVRPIVTALREGMQAGLVIP